MRITAILLLAGCLQVSARGYSQKLTLTETNVALDKVFREIKAQTHFTFFYNDEQLQHFAKVSIAVKDASVKEVLDLCFENQMYTYAILDNVVIIKPKEEPVGGNPNRPVDVHGHVTDSAGAPLAGASVTVQGHSGASAVTDANGNFSIIGISGNAILLVSNIGYETQEVKLQDKKEISIRLRPHSTTLLDAVVSKGYYDVSQRLNTGNVTVVKGEDISRQPVTDPLLALEGRVAGLYISQLSGVPGASSKVMLRGMNSIPDPSIKLSTVNDPLYVLDGVPYGSASLTGNFINSGAAGNPNQGTGPGLSPFNNLNPSDIESITVLKDADATAIYGSRGANGVILITTKKGMAGQTRLDASIQSGLGKVSRELHLLNTPQYLEMRHEGLNNDGYAPDPTIDFDLTNWDTTRYTNWQKVLIGNISRYTNAQLSLSGGNTQTQFLISGTLSDQGTLFPGNYDDRKISIHTSISSTSIDKRFHAQINTSYTKDINTLPDVDLTNYITLAPDAPAIYDVYGNLNWQILNGVNTWQNPLSYTVQRDKGATDNLNGDLVLGYRFFRGFEVKLNMGYTHSQLNQTNITPSTFAPPPFNANPYSRSLGLGTTDNTDWIIEPQATYNHKIRKGTLELLLGTTFQENENHSIAYNASGFSSDALITNTAAASGFGLAGNSYVRYDYSAVFGRIGLNWADKYLLNLTGRRDGSSRFGPGRQFGNFGALGAGWIFTKEPAILNYLSFLSSGKLRTSYGITGNDGIADYSFMSTYSAQPTTYQGASGLYPTRLSNPNIAWETVRKLEAGLELGFIHDRVLLSGSWYRNRTGNQLVTENLSTLTGFNGVVVNLPAVLLNTGVEFTASTINIRNKAFTWNSSFNISFPQNKLVAFPNLEGSPYQSFYVIGSSISSRRVFHYTGVDPQTGLYRFATKNANGIPDAPVDWVTTKPLTQKYFGGIMNSLSYRGFTLNIFIQFVKQLGYSFLRNFQMPGLPNTNQPSYVLGRWQKPGDVGNVQKFSVNNAGATFGYMLESDAVIADASFIRLKNIGLSYQFPKSWQKSACLQNASAFIHCQNLFVITKYKGLDPETQGLSLPPLRMVTAGIQLTL